MLLGLIRADSGIMHLFSEPTPAHLPKVISRIGASVESRRTRVFFSKAADLTLGYFSGYLLVMETAMQAFRPALQNWLVSAVAT